MKRISKIVCILVAVIITFSAAGYSVSKKVDAIPLQLGEVSDVKQLPDPEKELPVVGSYEKLKELLEKMQADENRRYGGVIKGKAMMDGGFANGVTATAEVQKTEAKAAAPAAPAADYSTTNVQVQGVDEADIVKTDGQYIYQVNKGRIVIARAYPAEEMKVVGSTGFADGSFVPLEMYLHDRCLVVIGSGSRVYPTEVSQSAPKKKPSILPRHADGTVKVMIYDITEKSDIKKLREVEVDGGYISSRKIGSALYLVANRHINYYYIQKEESGRPEVPFYRDSAAAGEYVTVPYEKIRYFPGCVEPNYLITAGLNLDSMNEEAEISTYLGAAQNVYASQENMYVAVTGYTAVKQTGTAEGKGTGVSGIAAEPVMLDRETTVYKFALNQGKMNYRTKGTVPGNILNQFSMDENGKYFRIATTKGEIWRNDEFTSKNNLYVLDENLKLTGKIEDIAPGERIYSVRFMGDRAYMVTFKTVDPLFVIDLKEPAKPKILGALKIPGYSDYIHPYDENHILGFGKDTVEMKGMAYYQGMKVAMFDVTDVTNPKELFVEKIGDRGTDSELLRNHKALLFNKEKNLLSFPVTVMEVQPETQNQNAKPALQYGQFAFQGAYVYQVDTTNGFKLKGKISHITREAYLKSGGGWYRSDRNIERILYIQDTLYTLSKGMIKANRLSDLSERAAVEIP